MLLSLILTFVFAIVYAFYPILAAIIASLSSSPDGTGGIGAVAGGLGESFLWTILLLEPALFLIIIILLERRRVRSS
ncbi:MAG: hypothetical protein ABR556_03350 [Pyrinomonadaceae bacterium]